LPVQAANRIAARSTEALFDRISSAWPLIACRGQGEAFETGRSPLSIAVPSVVV
jgi:hypothetical protein